jgi:hypothetical protein
MADQKLVEIVGRVIDLRRAEPRLNSVWVATEAMLLIDPRKSTQRRFPLAYLAAHLQLRQIARSEFRQVFDDDVAGDKRQHELFPGLQGRYPVAHKPGEEPEYVLRDLLTPEDVIYNVLRLNGEAIEKQRHARRLIAWAQKKFGRDFKAPKLKRA